MVRAVRDDAEQFRVLCILLYPEQACVIFLHPIRLSYLLFLTPSGSVPAVYVNSLLATLNARGSLLGGRTGRVHEIKASFHGSSGAATDRSRNQGIEVRSTNLSHSKSCWADVGRLWTAHDGDLGGWTRSVVREHYGGDESRQGVVSVVIGRGVVFGAR